MSTLKKNELTRVHFRLFAADVAEAKRRAAKEGLPWQVWLRLLVRKALDSSDHKGKLL